MNCNAGFGTVLPNGNGNLFFTLKLPKDAPASLQNRTCQFNFVFLAQQILPQPCSGPECPESENMIFAIFSPNIALAYFSDTEIITNMIKSGQWEEILPQKMVKPVEGWLIQRFDFAEDSGYQGHEGIDIDSQIEGKAVVAAADGTVVYVQREIISGAGSWVWIWHGAITDRENNKTEKISTRYLHLKEIPLEIQPGRQVDAGQTVIGKVSNTGDGLWQWRFSPHLHFEVRQGSSAEDIISGKTSYSSTIPLNPLHFVDYDDRSKKANSLTIFAYSPVDLVVIDPEGFIVSKEINTLPQSAWYFEMPIDEEGMPGYEFIAIDERKLGDYLIKVIPEVEALPTDTYTLEVLGENGNVVVAEAVRIAEIPLNPYILRLTETGIIPIIPAVVNFDPDILNLRSRGQWVTVYLELPVGKEVSEINLASIRLNKQIPIEPEPVEMGDYDRNGLPDLMIKFNREAIRNILEVGDKVKITISGELTDGRLFEGNDTIKVIK